MSKILEAIKAYEAAHLLAEQNKEIFSETIMAKIKKLWRLLGNGGNPYNFIRDISVDDQTVTVEFSYSYMGQTDEEMEILPIEFLNEDFDIVAYAEKVKAQWAEKARLEQQRAEREKQIENATRVVADSVRKQLTAGNVDPLSVSVQSIDSESGTITITITGQGAT